LCFQWFWGDGFTTRFTTIRGKVVQRDVTECGGGAVKEILCVEFEIAETVGAQRFESV
jgi:hypothetical protein